MQQIIVPTVGIEPTNREETMNSIATCWLLTCYARAPQVNLSINLKFHHGNYLVTYVGLEPTFKL